MVSEDGDGLSLVDTVSCFHDGLHLWLDEARIAPGKGGGLKHPLLKVDLPIPKSSCISHSPPSRSSFKSMGFLC